MNDYTNKIKILKKTRDRQVKKLNNLLKALVSAEWDMVTVANEKNDKVSYLASKSVSDASKNIQLAISQLILTDFSVLENNVKNSKSAESIQPLKKIVLGKQ